MKDFDFYEIIAVLAPGIVLVFGVLLLCPDTTQILDIIKNISLGGTALGLVIVYIIGQYVQFIGHYIEKLFWLFFKGMPSTWIVKKDKLIKGCQYDEIIEHIKKDGFDIHQKDFDFHALHHWLRNNANDNNRKLYIMNSQYGMFRGLVCVWLLLIIAKTTMWILGVRSNNFMFYILVTLLIISLSRMKHFGEYYARELYHKYLIIAKKEHVDKNILS